MTDKLDDIFSLRESFMNELKSVKPEEYPSWPVDISKKESQQHLRDMALRGVEEMFEALQHLKNWKPHRDSDLPDFNKDEFLEEVVDAFNYFISVLILTGIDSKDFYDSYLKKDMIIRNRLKNKY